MSRTRSERARNQVARNRWAGEQLAARRRAARRAAYLDRLRARPADELTADQRLILGAYDMHGALVEAGVAMLADAARMMPIGRARP